MYIYFYYLWCVRTRASVFNERQLYITFHDSRGERSPVKGRFRVIKTRIIAVRFQEIIVSPLLFGASLTVARAFDGCVIRAFVCARARASFIGN